MPIIVIKFCESQCKIHFFCLSHHMNGHLFHDHFHYDQNTVLFKTLSAESGNESFSLGSSPSHVKTEEKLHSRKSAISVFSCQVFCYNSEWSNFSLCFVAFGDLVWWIIYLFVLNQLLSHSTKPISMFSV